MALIGQEERTGNDPATSPLRFKGSVITDSGACDSQMQKGSFGDREARPLMTEAGWFAEGPECDYVLKQTRL